MTDRLSEYLLHHGIALVFSAVIIAYWVSAFRRLMQWRRRTAQTLGIVVAQPARSGGSQFYLPRYSTHGVTLDIRYLDHHDNVHILHSNISDFSDETYNSRWLWLFCWGYKNVPHFAIGSEVLVDYDPHRPENSSFSANNIDNWETGVGAMYLIMGLISLGIIVGTATTITRCFSAEHRCSPPIKGVHKDFNFESPPPTWPPLPSSPSQPREVWDLPTLDKL